MGLILLSTISLSTITAALGDDDSTQAITEYESTSRLLISLLHEPCAAAVSSDDSLLATGHDDGTIVLWNLETGLPVKRLVGHTETVSALAFDHSGGRLASGSYDATARVWDVETGQAIHVLKGHTSRLNVIVFSPSDDRLLSGGYDKSVRLWDLNQPDTEPLVLTDHEATVWAAAFSPSGEQFVTGDDAGTICVRSISNPEKCQSVEAHSGAVRSLLFSPDGEFFISGGGDGAVIRWDAESLEQAQSPPGLPPPPLHDAPVTSLAIAADGQLLISADQRGQAQTWDFTTGRVTSHDGHEDEICHVGVLSQGESLLTVSRDRAVKVWRSRIPATPRLATIDDVNVKLWTLAISPDDATLFAGGTDGFLAAWDLAAGRQLMRYEGFDGTVDAVALTSDGAHIACCGWREETIVIFAVQSGERKNELAAGTKVRCLQFSPDGRRLVSGGEDGTITIWDWEAGKQKRSLRNSALPVYDVAFSPEGNRLVAGSGDWRKSEPGDVTFWNADDWSVLRKATEHTRAVRTVTFDRSGTRVATAGEDGLVILWHGETHVPIARFQNGDGIRPVVFSPSGTQLAVGLHSGTINLWDIDRGEVVQRFQTEDDVFEVSFSQDGTALFSVSGEERIEIWPTKRTTSTVDRIGRWKRQGASQSSREEDG